MFDILTIGNATQDIFLFPKEAEIRDGHSKAHPFPELCFLHGSKISIDHVAERIGGNAANVAVALARLGHRTAASLFVGNDDWGRKILSYLDKERVDTQYTYIDKKSQTAFSTLIVYQAERTILSFHGNIDFTKQANKLPKKKVARWIYLTSVAGNWQGVYNQAISLAAEQGVLLAINPGAPQLEAGMTDLRGILHVTSILFVNREEALRLTHLPAITRKDELARELASYGPKIVIITDGQAGALAADSERIYSLPMFPGQRLEPTGAGDSFASGVLGRLLYEDHGTLNTFSEKAIKEALCWGAVNAASVVASIGPQDGLLSRRQLEDRLKHHPGFKVRSQSQ